jgi:hypothetical protein
VADVDGDGFEDILVLSQGTSHNVDLYLFLDKLSYLQVVLETGEATPTHAAARLGLVVVSFKEAGQVKLYRLSSDGRAVTSVTLLEENLRVDFVAFAHANDDSAVDVLAFSEPKQTGWLDLIAGIPKQESDVYWYSGAELEPNRNQIDTIIQATRAMVVGDVNGSSCWPLRGPPPSNGLCPIPPPPLNPKVSVGERS